MNWLYEGKEVTEVDENVFGFIYMITCNTTSKKYIGKKQTISRLNKPLTKKEITEWKETHTGGRPPKKKLVIKESNWRTYWGSSKELNEYVKENGKENFTREILQFCYHKKQLTYYETKYLFKMEVLESDDYWNSDILGKFHRKDLEN